EVEPCTTGRVIVSTRQPHEKVVLETIRDLGLELQVIFNKGAVMILPSGTNKATGLASALEKLQVPLTSAVAIGDAENDHGCSSLADYPCLSMATSRCRRCASTRAPVTASWRFSIGGRKRRSRFPIVLV